MPEQAATVQWIDATLTPPPFHRYVLIVTGRFNDPERRAQAHRMMIARVVPDSPNDEEAGNHTEYASWRKGEADYHEYQFYLQPADKAWMGQIKVAVHGGSDFCDLFSDAISHWAECPALPPLTDQEDAA